MLLKLLALLFTLHGALAQFVVSFDKSSYSPGDSIDVTWYSSNSAVDLSDQTAGSLLLCTCNSSSDFHCSYMKRDIPVQSEKSIKIQVNDILTLGPDGSYLLQLATSSTKSDAYTLAYSRGWFTLSGMTGTGSAGKDCDVPYGGNFNFPNTASTTMVSWTSWTLPAQYQTVSNVEIPYSLQAGPTRYAPTQRTPGTKITQTTTPTRRYPTSSVSIRSTYYFNKYLPVTTVTPSGIPYTQKPNFAETIATTPTGRYPSPVVASFQGATSSASKNKRKRRWADF